MHLVYNERWKLTAAWLNTIGAAAIAAGVIAPLVAIAYGIPNYVAGWGTILASLIWLGVGGTITFDRKVGNRQAPGMTPLEIYTTFILPLLVLSIGGVVLIMVRLDERRERRAAKRAEMDHAQPKS